MSAAFVRAVLIVLRPAALLCDHVVYVCSDDGAAQALLTALPRYDAVDRAPD